MIGLRAEATAQKIAAWLPLSPWRFAAAVAILYLLALLPALRQHHFDISTFIVAGDKFVDRAHTPSPIVVRHYSAGYDGQFYFGMALDPFAPSTLAPGVTFDHPAWRWQRILYPMLAYLLALGCASLIPASLLAINLASLVALAVFAARAARPQQHATLRSWTFMLWPGFMTALTHDTTELLACVLLVAALIAYTNQQYVRFAVLGACAAITRETCSLAIAGIALAAIPACLANIRQANPAHRKSTILTAARPPVFAGAALLPFLLWHLFLAQHWVASTEAAPLHANIGWPLVGVAQRLGLSLTGLASTQNLSFKTRLASAYAAATALFIIGFSVHVARSIPPLWRRGGNASALVGGWLGMMLLISLLSAQGPWVDPTAIFRAFSECFVTGFLIVTLTGRQLSCLPSLAILPLAYMNWLVCLVQLR